MRKIVLMDHIDHKAMQAGIEAFIYWIIINAITKTLLFDIDAYLTLLAKGMHMIKTDPEWHSVIRLHWLDSIFF